MLLYIALIVFFSFFTRRSSSIGRDGRQSWRKYGGFIPGIRPGKNTSDYLDTC